MGFKVAKKIFVSITWVDAAYYDGWQGTEDSARTLVVVETCGRLLSGPLGEIHVALSCGDNGRASDVIVIPMRMIRKIRYLRYARKVKTHE